MWRAPLVCGLGHLLRTSSRRSWTDGRVGGSYSFPLAIMSNTPLYTSSRRMKMKINRKKAGMPVCNSAWSCGTRPTLQYTPVIVSRHTNQRKRCCCSLMLRIVAANHRFNAEESDWGFTRFSELRKMFAAQWDGAGRPMVEHDAVNVTAYVRIYKDPTGVLWHSFEKSVIGIHVARLR